MNEAILTRGSRKLGRLPSLDGWRAISICMVLLVHATYMHAFPSAWIDLVNQLIDSVLGVRFFFLISGFLITWLIIREFDKNGKIDLKLFYLRRSLRILPVHFAYLLILCIFSIFTKFEQSDRVWLANITFTTNFMLDRDWHGVPLPSMHLWSLAVEEQFYLIWPPILAMVKSHFAVVFLLVVPLMTAPVARFVSSFDLYNRDWSPLFAPTSFLNYFDAIAIGAGSAILVTAKWGQLYKWMGTRRKRIFWGGALMVILPHVLPLYVFQPHVIVHHKIFKMANVAFGPSLQALGFAVLLVQSIFLPGWGVYRLLNVALLRFVGRLSFSLYIWQQIFCSPPEVYGLAQDTWWTSFPVGLLLSVLAALLSYALLEYPFMNLRARLHSSV